MKMRSFTLGAVTICASLAVFMRLHGGATSENNSGTPSSGTVVTDIRSIAVGAPETRELMLRGKLANFWQVVDEKAPEDLDYVINRFFEARSDLRTSDDVREKLDREMLAYRLRLAKYSRSLSDSHRIDIINARSQFLRAFDNPADCAVAARHGAWKLSTEKLSSVYKEIDKNAATIVSHLLDARASGNSEDIAPPSPTDRDYDVLEAKMKSNGVSEDDLSLLYRDTWRDPAYCDVYLSYYENLAGLTGPAGFAIRFDEVNALLNSQ